MLHKVSLLYNWLVWIMTYFLPDMPLIMRFRGWLYGLMLKRSGKNFQVTSSVRILGSRKIEIGDNVFLAHNVVVNSGGLVVLDSEVLIGIGSVVVAGNHTLLDGSYRFGPRDNLPIHVGRGSWIGANCTLVGGAKVPESTLIAASSVVVGELETVGLWGGVPAKLIRETLGNSKSL